MVFCLAQVKIHLKRFLFINQLRITVSGKTDDRQQVLETKYIGDKWLFRSPTSTIILCKNINIYGLQILGSLVPF